MSKRKQDEAQEASQNFDELTVFELKRLLKAKDLSTAGTKAQLISRLNETKSSDDEQVAEESDDDKEEEGQREDEEEEEVEEEEEEQDSDKENVQKKTREVKQKKEAPKPRKGPLNGLNFAIAGRKEDLGGHTPKQVSDLITKKGGSVGSRVTSKTTHLLCGGDDGSEKYITAIELRTPIIDFYEFQKLVKGEKLKSADVVKSPRKTQKYIATAFEFDDEEGLDQPHPETPKKKKTTTKKRKSTKTTTTKKKRTTRKQSYRRERSGSKSVYDY